SVTDAGVHTVRAHGPAAPAVPRSHQGILRLLSRRRRWCRQHADRIPHTTAANGAAHGSHSSMKVLGISPLDKDATVTLVEDGEIIYAAGEERFTRVKLQDGFPWNALADALRATGTETADISAVMYPFFEWQEETRLFKESLALEREFLEDSADFEGNALLRAARTKTP